MCEGYGSCSVCLYVTELAAKYLVHVLKIRNIRLSVLISMHVYIVWISLKTLCSKVMATFADHLLLLDQFSMDKRDSDGFFTRKLVCRTMNTISLENLAGN